MSVIHVDNLRFWLLSLGILIVWQLVWVTSAPLADDQQQISNSAPPLNYTEQQKVNCKTLCEQCDCMGFYCGEECLCECNNNNYKATHKGNKQDTECLAVMQNNARALELPFELLIQGSNNNRIVRTAMQLQNQLTNDNNKAEVGRVKRTTVVIYKPPTVGGSITTEKSTDRARREASKDNLDWLTDFANGLVRPAPMNGMRKTSSTQSRRKSDDNVKPQAVKVKEDKRERAWFENDSVDAVDKPMKVRGRKTYNRPAVGYKKSRTNKEDSKKRNSLINDNDNYSMERNMRDASAESLAELLYKTPMKMVEKLPAAVGDAIRRMRMNAEMSNANRKRETELLDMEDHATWKTESLEERSNEWHEEYDESHEENFEEVLKNMRRHLLNAVGMPKGGTSKSSGPVNRITKSPYYRSSDFMQRIQDAMGN